MKDRWLPRLISRLSRCRLRRIGAAALFASTLTTSNVLGAQESLPYWYESFPELAESADSAPRPAVRFVWQEDEFDREGESGRIQRTLYQAQYPLSKDAEDLLPREDHWNRLRQDERPDECFDADSLSPDSSDESRWIVWEKTVSSFTWIAPNSGGLGVTSLDARGSIEFPDFQALWFAPRVAWHSLNGPTITDLPPNLYDVSFETVGMIPIGERWFVQAALAPSFFTDSENTGGKAFRLPGRAVAFWKYSEKLTITAGVLYLDREDVKAIPCAGLLWNPNDDWKFELAAPRPRIAKRISQENDVERWGYIVGEFGGGTWAIRRASGVNDVVSLQDYRFLFGFEQKGTDHHSWLVEAGYVFSRRLQYTSKLGDTDLPGTALLRLGMTF